MSPGPHRAALLTWLSATWVAANGVFQMPGPDDRTDAELVLSAIRARRGLFLLAAAAIATRTGRQTRGRPVRLDQRQEETHAIWSQCHLRQ
jgi:hypothetical protein